MRTKKFFNYLASAIIVCCATCMITSCQGLIDAVVGNVDNPASTTQPAEVVSDLLKQGIWTEYDGTASVKYTDEQLDMIEHPENYTEEQLDAFFKSNQGTSVELPDVGMKIEGDKAYFFTYTAESVSDFVEGKISYNKSANTGTITFPAIAGSPISGQSVNFSMTSDETMEFEFTYEGQKTAGTCAWLCENIDDWGVEVSNEEWEELMGYYKTIGANWGPDPSIDWNDSEVEGLDEPLEWNEPASVASARGGTRMVTAVMEGVSAGLDIFSSLFEEDPNEVINQKLDAITGKLDKVLANQNEIKEKINNINLRLITIADMMKQKETVEKFTYRDEQYCNQLKLQDYYFNEAYSLYKKGNLTNENKNRLGDLAKKWAGDNKTYINKTWLYIDYITTVTHSVYRTTGMDQIYDRLTFDKYPWEHMGIGDRQCYRAYDLFMITKCLFMISLYYNYGGLDNDDKNNLDSQFQTYNPPLKRFCEFKVADPNKFRVCQIPGAHFIMHKELQKYNYCGEKVTYATSSSFGNGCKAPNPKLGESVLYRPEWHEAGNIKIENPKELASKLILDDEAIAIYNYFKAAVYPNNEKILWTNMLVKDKNIADKDNKAGGAIYAKDPTDSKDTRPFLMLGAKKWATGMRYDHNLFTTRIDFSPLWLDEKPTYGTIVGAVKRIPGSTNYHDIPYWDVYYNEHEYYAAIVAKHY